MTKSPSELPVTISALNSDGLGIADSDGKSLLVRNALPEENVQARILRRRKGKLLCDGVEVKNDSADRSRSACQFFPRCGGCNMHHIRADAQLALKQQQLIEALAQHEVQPNEWLAPQSAGHLGYRRKARLGVRQVGEQVFVGFRESFSNRVARIDACMVLTPQLSALISPLRELIANLSIADKIPQIEVAQGEGWGRASCVLMVRHLAPFNENDLALWQALERKYNICILLQSGGYDTLRTLTDGPATPLGYRIPSSGLYMQFMPEQFIQVNLRMNLVLIRHVLAFLGNLQNKTVADLFCGIGNFTLPLARGGARVTGYEAVSDAVDMARHNAALNGLTDMVNFAVDDLYGADSSLTNERMLEVDALVLDPPRSGVGPNLPRWMSVFSGDQIVYVSCNPATFAADAVHILAAGFQLEKVGVFDMFPHTAHVETVGYFRRTQDPNGVVDHG